MSPTRGKKTGFYYGYILVSLGFLITLMNAGILSSYGVFFKPLSEEFGWTRVETSGAYSLSVLLFGFLGIFTGRLSDRFGPKLVVTVCGLLLGLGTLLMSQINAVWQLYLFFGLIVGTGRSGGPVPLMSAVARWFVKRRGLMTGILVAGFGGGQVVMPLIASQLITVHGWRTSYIILGIISLVVIVGAAQFLRNDRPQIGHMPDSERLTTQEDGMVLKAKDFSFREAIITKQFWLLCIVYFCFGLLAQSVMVHIVPHATDLGISAVSAASIVSIIGVLSMVGRIGMGSAGDRIGNKLALVIVFVLMTISLLLLLFAEELWMFYLFAAMFGFAWGAEVAQSSPIVANLFGIRAHGLILGIVVFGSTVGGSIGPLLTGRIFDVTGSYRLAFIIFAVIAVVALILSLLLKPTHKEGLV